MRIEVQGGIGAQPGTVYFGALTSTNVVVRSLRINPRNTYLRTSNDPDAGPAEAIDLSSLSLRSGDTVRLRRLGSFRYDPPSPNLLSTMAGVFSTNSLLRSPSSDRRVVGAVATGKPYETLPTLEGGVLSTDIQEDFEINDTLVCIPNGAQFLFISANDFFFGDNSDEDGDYQLEITKYIYEDLR